MWATSVPILVFLDPSVLDLGPMYVTDVRRHTDVRRASSFNAPAMGGGIIIKTRGRRQEQEAKHLSILVDWPGRHVTRLHAHHQWVEHW